MDGLTSQNEGFTRVSSMSRPSARSIYEQRKQYVQSLNKERSTFHHRVEHLLTCELNNELRTVEDCLAKLRTLDAEGRVWGQELILQVNDGELLLNDLETQESLEKMSLHDVVTCRSILGKPPYNSLLTIMVQSYINSSVLLFQCNEQPADVIHGNMEKVLKTFKANKESKNNLRNNLENVLTHNPITAQQPSFFKGWESPNLERGSITDSPYQQRKFEPEPPLAFQPSTSTDFTTNQMTEMERDIEVLNHVLRDIELFVGTLGPDKKKKKRGKSAIPELECIDCLQKIKYSFNLMAKVQDHIQEPKAKDLIHIMMTTLPKVLSNSPRKDIAFSVVSPFLTQKALTMLSYYVTEEERRVWESLGDAWMRTRADWPNGKNLPSYIPIFSDGWIPPEISSNSYPVQIPNGAQTPATNRRSQTLILRVLYDFEARNSRELSVKKGDNVEVLDQSRQWWMVKNSEGDRGFIPSNILESVDDGQAPVRALSLQPGSRPEEVTTWLQQKGFSNITVRCLGVLRGDQLLDLSLKDLKEVCPEEGGRVYKQLHPVQIGVAP
ncbi:epidermal growth factor receptor kinase substrate 8-like protein 3 [Bombina bombina]|uniref:epidermal growth factor receptor kinase substrate 8-like protein 3 n=1 Tax=Bombina bombina TaxID=8345 RepID=UPI00235A9EED|nr:epidermal growth factor receptor kinase substrate 8-like protein 3 [Bombina bombina]